MLKHRLILARILAESSPKMSRNLLKTCLVKIRPTQYPKTTLLAAPTVASEAIPGWCSARENRQFKGQARSHPVIPCHTPDGTAATAAGLRDRGRWTRRTYSTRVPLLILRWCCVTPSVLAMRPIRSGIPMTSPQCTGDDSVASGLLQGHRRPWCLSLLAGYTKLRLHSLTLSERVTLV